MGVFTTAEIHINPHKSTKQMYDFIFNFALLHLDAFASHEIAWPKYLKCSVERKERSFHSWKVKQVPKWTYKLLLDPWTVSWEQQVLIVLCQRSPYANYCTYIAQSYCYELGKLLFCPWTAMLTTREKRKVWKRLRRGVWKETRSQ